jgi:hypothetical protein
MAALLPPCPRGLTVAEKLAYYSIPEPNSGCLLWLGGCDGHGHGHIHTDDRLRTALRAVRELLKQAKYQTDPRWASRLISDTNRIIRDALRETP